MRSHCRTSLRAFAVALFWAVSSQAATFGRVVPVLGGGADIVLDESGGRVYITSSVQNLVQVYTIQNQSLAASVTTDQTPLSAALSRDGKSLYVTCYDSSALDIIDTSSLAVTGRVGLPARPEGVAVASDGRVLISTTGSGTNAAANVLLLYDPSPNAAQVLVSIPVAPAAPTPPTVPPPSGRPFLASHGQLRATRDGSLIIGVNVPGTGSPTVFVYQVASQTVLRSRIVAGSSTVITISDDGTRFLCGPNLFDTSTLQVLAQQNLANVPYPVTPGTSFNVQSSQGGGVFSPDGLTLYSAFDVAPVQNANAAPSNISQLMLNDPDNLLVHMALQLPENLAGKMVISSDGANIYALSDSGFMILPVGSISQSPLAVPSSDVVLLTKDQCGVYSQTASAMLTINNPGRGRVSATAQLLQFTGVANQPSPANAPSVRPAPGATPQFMFTYNSAATSRGLGTIAPPHDFLIQSPEAINIPDRVRVFENNRDSDSRGTVIPIPGGSFTGEAFLDLAYDATRQRVYIANTGLNRVEVYDIQQQQLLAPIKVGQLPSSLALTPDGNTLYVANSGGENISVVDPGSMQTVGRVAFPPIPFNSNAALMTPALIAASLNGPIILMNNGSLWMVIGNTAVPRGVSKLLGQTAAGLPVAIPTPSSMAASPDGRFVMLATNTGIADLYDSSIDDWVVTRQVFTGTQTGYVGPVTAGPQGRYFVMNGTVLNSSLVPVSNTTGLVSAVAQAGNSSYALFSPPMAAGSTAALTAPTIQVGSIAGAGPGSQVSALEGPITQVTGTARATISGRTMVVDSSGTNAYVITVSGLSIIPLAPVATSSRPQPNPRGAVNLASYLTSVAPNGLLSIFGTNLGSNAVVGSTPLPTMVGGTCVTLNNVALPLFMVSPLQINAQIPPNMAAGTYPLVIRSVSGQAASVSQQLTVSKYAPAVLVDSTGQIALFHADGSPVNKDNPANRDEPLTMYALGLGPTTGGAVTSGMPSPASPLAITGAVEVFFGDPSYKQAGIIVDWSGLTPGYIGLYQLNLRVPGFHISGDSLLVTLRVGGVNSPSTGPVVPKVAVN